MGALSPSPTQITVLVESNLFEHHRMSSVNLKTCGMHPIFAILEDHILAEGVSSARIPL